MPPATVLRKTFTWLVPQTKTVTERMIHGIQAFQASARELGESCFTASRSPSKRQIFFGCQNLSST